MKSIDILAEGISLSAELNEGSTAQKIWEALPIDGTANTWGDEIYFGIQVEIEEEPEARADIRVGDLGYWPPGHAFCIFFGPTPASTDEHPRAASPVNVFGCIKGDATLFRTIRDGSSIRIERSSQQRE